MAELVQAQLAPIQTRAGIHDVKLTLANKSSEVVLIDPFNLCEDGNIVDSIFEITDRDGKVLRYQGPRIKRGEPKFEAFFKLRPGAAFATTCHLDTAYKFDGRPGPYIIRYSVANMHPKLAYFEIDSKPITLP